MLWHSKKAVAAELFIQCTPITKRDYTLRPVVPRNNILHRWQHAPPLAKGAHHCDTLQGFSAIREIERVNIL